MKFIKRFFRKQQLRRRIAISHGLLKDGKYKYNISSEIEIFITGLLFVELPKILIVFLILKLFGLV